MRIAATRPQGSSCTRRIARHIGRSLPALALAFGLAACDAGTGPLLAPNESALQLEGADPTSSFKLVVINPEHSTINAIGGARTLGVTVRNGSGRPMINPTVVWTSLDPGIATVDAAGRVRAVGAGMALITAASMGAADTATVEVRQVIASVEVTPDSASVPINGTFELSATATDSNGVAIPEARFDWASSDPEVAVVQPNGVVTGAAVGTVEITATAADAPPGSTVGATATLVVTDQGPGSPRPPAIASVVVTPESGTIQSGATLQLSAEAFDADGNPVQASFTWSSATPAIATVSSSGLVTGVSAGVVGIQAEASGAADVSIVTVEQTPSPPSPPPPPPPGGYSPTTPHWPHIRTEVTDFRIRTLPSQQQAAEYDWTAAHYDVVMDGPARPFKQRNPQIRVAPYQLALAFQQTAQRENIEALQAWYADPSKNTQGYRLEDAFLHTALPKSQSNRVTFTIWGSARWAMNPGDPGYRAFLADHIRNRIYEDPQYPADGIFIDEHDPHNIDRAQGAVEYPNWSAFDDAIVGMWQYVRSRIPGKYIQINPAEFGGARVDRWVQAAGAVHIEHFHYALREVHRRWDRAEGYLAAGVEVTIVGNWRLENYNNLSDAGFSRGNHQTKGGRGKIFELAGYYLIRPNAANIDRLRLQNLNTWGQPFSSQWLPIYGVDVGHPSENRRQYATGTDPVGMPYTIWGREYTNALVLARSPMDYTQQERCQDATGVNVSLPSGRTWYLLREDGTLTSSALSSVTIRNCEAVILIKG